MSNFKSQYPKIITDKMGNSVNEGLKKIVTIEEWYDVTHHTHDISTLSVSSEDGITYDDLVGMVNELSNTVTSLQNAVKTLTEEMNNMTSVKDWDLDTPGNQDANGNDLGTLMGFNITEIE